MRYDACINETVGFNYLKDPPQIGGFGYPSTGKSWLQMALANQWFASMTFDPQSRAIPIIKEQCHNAGMSSILRQWVFLKLGYDKKSNLQIAAKDLHLRIVDSLAPTRSPRDRKIRDAFELFFKKKRQERTFDYLENCFKAKRVENIFETEIKPLIDPYDQNNKLLRQLNSKKSIIDISDLPRQSNLPGLLIESLVGWRKDNRFPKSPLLIQMDEAQMYASYQSMTGRAIANCAMRTRIFGVSTSVFGTNYTALHNDIRKTIKILFLFKNNFDPGNLRSEFGINITREDIMNITFGDTEEKKGYFIFFNHNEGKVNGKLTKANLFYFNNFKKTEKSIYHFNKPMRIGHFVVPSRTGKFV